MHENFAWRYYFTVLQALMMGFIFAPIDSMILNTQIEQHLQRAASSGVQECSSILNESKSKLDTVKGLLVRSLLVLQQIQTVSNHMLSVQHGAAGNERRRCKT